MVRFPVDVVLERVPLESQWAEAQWRLVTVAAAARHDESAVDTWSATCLEGGERARWRFSGGAIELRPGDAESYCLNVSAPVPVVFVLLREVGESVPRAPPYPMLVTVDYDEAARLLDADEIVESVPMPDEIAALVNSFVEAHFRPDMQRKRKREGGDTAAVETPQSAARRESHDGDL